MTHRLETAGAATDAGTEMAVPHSLSCTRKTTAVPATTQSLAVSVLDLVPTRAGGQAPSAIMRSVELARHVEQLGYKRYWIAEHHAIQGLACSATPVLIGHIAATKQFESAAVELCCQIMLRWWLPNICEMSPIPSAPGALIPAVSQIRILNIVKP